MKINGSKGQPTSACWLLFASMKWHYRVGQSWILKLPILYFKSENRKEFLPHFSFTCVQNEENNDKYLKRSKWTTVTIFRQNLFSDVSQAQRWRSCLSWKSFKMDESKKKSSFPFEVTIRQKALNSFSVSKHMWTFQNSQNYLSFHSFLIFLSGWVAWNWI